MRGKKMKTAQLLKNVLPVEQAHGSAVGRGPVRHGSLIRKVDQYPFGFICQTFLPELSFTRGD